MGEKKTARSIIRHGRVMLGWTNFPICAPDALERIREARSAERRRSKPHDDYLEYLDGAVLAAKIVRRARKKMMRAG